MVSSESLYVSVWLAVALPDDFQKHLHELLPKFLSLFSDAERTGDYKMVEAALGTLEMFGPSLEEHLPLLLPAFVRMICPGTNLVSQGEPNRYVGKFSRRVRESFKLWCVSFLCLIEGVSACWSHFCSEAVVRFSLSLEGNIARCGHLWFRGCGMIRSLDVFRCCLTVSRCKGLHIAFGEGRTTMTKLDEGCNHPKPISSNIQGWIYQDLLD